MVEGGAYEAGGVKVEGFECFVCVRDVHVDVGLPWLFGKVLLDPEGV